MRYAYMFHLVANRAGEREGREGQKTQARAHERGPATVQQHASFFQKKIMKESVKKLWC